jgi:hypothetical protein
MNEEVLYLYQVRARFRPSVLFARQPLNGGSVRHTKIGGALMCTFRDLTLCQKSDSGPKSLLWVSAILALFGTSFASSQILSVDQSNRHLITKDGKPFLMVGEAAWSLIAQLKDEDVDYYLQTAHNRGFNVVLVNLIEHEFASHAPQNYYRQSPFTGSAFSSTPNEDYFVHADHAIASAAQQGIYVMLAPVYLGYGCGGEGWCSEVKSASVSDMQSWGAYVGQRYAGYQNIIWVIGGDTDPGSVKSKVQAVVDGIKQYDTVHLFTAHNNSEEQAITPWSGTTWLDINNVYTYSNTLFSSCSQAYKVSPTMPFFLIEAAYENEHSSTQQQLRAQSYWTVLSGGIGHIFGNCPVWHFDSSPGWCGVSGWKNQMNSQGHLNMGHFRDLFSSRRWGLLIPDANHKALTAGYGSSTSFAAAAYCSDSSSIIAYLPTSRAVTLNLSMVGGDSAAVWWFKPSTGDYTREGTYGHTSQSFTPPSSGDWVLVADNEDIYPDTSVPVMTGVVEAARTQTIPGGVYPNPFRSTLHIMSQNGSLVEVFDILGRRVYTQGIQEGQTIVSWTPRNLSYGVYFVRVGGPFVKPFKVLYAP